MDQSITLWSIFKLRGGIVMKLIFKDGQELVIMKIEQVLKLFMGIPRKIILE